MEQKCGGEGLGLLASGRARPLIFICEKLSKSQCPTNRYTQRQYSPLSLPPPARPPPRRLCFNVSARAHKRRLTQLHGEGTYILNLCRPLSTLRFESCWLDARKQSFVTFALKSAGIAVWHRCSIKDSLIVNLQTGNSPATVQQTLFIFRNSAVCTQRAACRRQTQACLICCLI